MILGLKSFHVSKKVSWYLYHGLIIIDGERGYPDPILDYFLHTISELFYTLAWRFWITTRSYLWNNECIPKFRGMWQGHAMVLLLLSVSHWYKLMPISLKFKVSGTINMIFWLQMATYRTEIHFHYVYADSELSHIDSGFQYIPDLRVNIVPAPKVARTSAAVVLAV